jgi:O-antigen/teichoic acid export membrane protein
LARNFLSLFLSNVVGQLFTLWAFVRIAALFGPEGFGRFSFAQVVALHGMYLADFGLQTLGTRIIAQGAGKVSDHVRDISALRIVLATGCFLLLVLVALLLPKPGEVQILIVLFSLGFFPFAVLFEWVFLGLERMEIVGIGRILKGMVFAGLVLALPPDPGQLTSAALCYVAGFVAAAGVLVAIYLRRFGYPGGSLDRVAIRSTLISAAPLAVGSLIAQINFNFGIIALGFFVSDHTVGVYSAAYKIVVFLLAFAVIAAANSVFPLMARSYKESTGRFDQALKKLLRLFAMIAIPIGVGGTVLASRIMGFLYSPEYHEGTIVLQLSIWIVVLAIYRVIFENALIASNSRRAYFTGYALAGTLTVLGNVILGSPLGMIAPVVAGICSELALLAYFFVSCRHVRTGFLLRASLGPAMAALCMGLILLLVPVGLGVGLAMGGVAYLAFLVIFRCITVQEIRAYLQAVAHSGLQSAP